MYLTSGTAALEMEGQASSSSAFQVIIPILVAKKKVPWTEFPVIRSPVFRASLFKPRGGTPPEM